MTGQGSSQGTSAGTGQDATTVFGVEPASVTAAAQALADHAEKLAHAAGTFGGAVPEAKDLPGGRLHGALRDGASRFSGALDGEAVAVDVCAGDLHSFVAAVSDAEAASARSLSGSGGNSGGGGE